MEGNFAERERSKPAPQDDETEAEEDGSVEKHDVENRDEYLHLGCHSKVISLSLQFSSNCGGPGTECKDAHAQV